MINRRTFSLSALGAFLTTPFTSLAAKPKTKPFTTPRKFIFEGHEFTEYLWPRDRLIHMEGIAPEGRQTILVPTFDIDKLKISLEQQLRNYLISIRNSLESVRYSYLFRVDGLPNHIGILGTPYEVTPVLDCWAESCVLTTTSFWGVASAVFLGYKQFAGADSKCGWDGSDSR